MGRPLESSDPASDICPYDLDFFAEKHGISKKAATVHLHTNGLSRARCDYAAEAYLRFKALREARVKQPASSINYRVRPPTGALR